jgi:hypothetical protein
MIGNLIKTYVNIQPFLVPLYLVLSTFTLWGLIAIHIIFPIGWEWIYNIINSIFVVVLAVQALWIYKIFIKNK